VISADGTRRRFEAGSEVAGLPDPVVVGP
jgi:hypothetical protein